ncbi:cation diffusion facilitator family transporter [Nonomuraea recticatena]|uniref:cation diffusion facilitator family transporter n=1 Tax=Nonomuraea recticatena TaxID=46178 RepID=UPI00361137E2
MGTPGALLCRGKPAGRAHDLNLPLKRPGRPRRSPDGAGGGGARAARRACRRPPRRRPHGRPITHGFHTISHGENLSDLTLSYLVLAVSFVIEAVSWRKAMSQVRAEAGRLGVSRRAYVARTSDTALKAMLFEDSAALAGLVIAALGLLGAQLTGDPAWDGVASVVIGVLLLAIALNLIAANVSLLIGQAAPRGMETRIRATLLAQPEVEDVVELLTMMLGPGRLMVAAKIDFRDEASAAGLEIACDEVDRRLRERYPGIVQVFLDPTPTRADRRGE